MMEAIRQWIVRLTCAAIVSASALALTPEGSVKKVVRLVCGILTVTVLLSAAVTFDLEAFSRSAAQYQTEAEQITGLARQQTEQLLRRSIEERCAAYIWDKACDMGINLTKAEVSAAWSEDGYWYPVGAVIEGEYTPEQQLSLASAVEAELGIEKGKQTWGTGNEN